MEELLTALSSEWAIRALITSSLVGIMCGMIGCFIVLRNMSLIGDALAHAILPGVFFAFLLFGYSTIGFFFGSVVAGLFTAFGITWIQLRVKTKNDAAIGIVFTAMFAIGIMGISWISREEGVHLDLTDFLFGTVLGISNEDIYLTLGVTVYVVLSIIIFYRYLFITTFQPTIAQTMGISVKMMHYFLMLLLSFAVVSALRSVGVILVVAMLITPASTALLLSDKLKNVLFISAFIGLISASIGLVLAIIFNTNPGPAMTVTVTAIYLMTALFGRKKGLVFGFFRKRRQRAKIEQEDILRQAIKAKDSIFTLNGLESKLNFGLRKMNNHLNRLIATNFVRKENNAFILTTEGHKKANMLVRAHRLWESYQVEAMGLDAEQIHDEADKFEHFLSEKFLDEVDAKLGYPKTDPHGSPIPERPKPTHPLSSLTIDQMGAINKIQISDYIESELWELGLPPEAKFKIKENGEKEIILLYNDKSISVDKKLASLIEIKPN